MRSHPQSLLLIAVSLVGTLHLCLAGGASAQGIVLSNPAYVVEGQQVSVTAESRNGVDFEVVGTLAVSLQGNVAGISASPAEANVILPESESTLAFFERTGDGWSVAGRDKWGKAQYPHIEIFKRKWLPGETESLTIAFTAPSQGSVAVQARVSFGTEPGQVGFNDPPDGKIDQMGLPILSHNLTVLPRNFLDKMPSPENIAPWLGFYSFSEDAAGDVSMFWSHGLAIGRVDDQYLGLLQVDGHLTMTRLICGLIADGRFLHLYLRQYGAENQHNGYPQISALLLTLERKSPDILLTHWNEYQPNLYANMRNGRKYFVKESPQDSSIISEQFFGQERKIVYASTILQSKSTAADTTTSVQYTLPLENTKSATTESRDENIQTKSPSLVEEPFENAITQDDEIADTGKAIDPARFLLVLLFILVGLVVMFFLIRLLVDLFILLCVLGASGAVYAFSSQLESEAVVAISIAAGAAIGLLAMPLLPFSRVFRPKSKLPGARSGDAGDGE